MINRMAPNLANCRLETGQVQRRLGAVAREFEAFAHVLALRRVDTVAKATLHEPVIQWQTVDRVLPVAFDPLPAAAALPSLRSKPFRPFPAGLPSG